jgi:hypothetical protein
MESGRVQWGHEEIATYLHYGYLPKVPDALADLPGWGLERDEGVARASHSERVTKGRRAFAAAFDELPEGPHVVPLSGGLDSRAVLAELCRRISPASITAITVGVPGSLDYALSSEVARTAGVRHLRIDLAERGLKVDDLESAALGNDAPTWLFDAHYNRLMRETIGPEAVYWSGFLGSRLTSTKHLAPNPGIGFPAAVARFVETNRWARTARLAPPDADLRRSLPSQPLAEPELLGHDEQRDIWIRQETLTRPVNLPAGYRHRTPFTHPSPASLFLSIPRTGGLRRQVYLDMVLEGYPRFFSLPTTANAGLALVPTRRSRLRWFVGRGARGVRRRVLPAAADVWQSNYLDMGHVLRRRADYRGLARERLQNLVDRAVAPWLNVELLWQEHQRCDADHALALTLLVSLDLHLDAAART